jgi:O-succinylbenzoate synthase
MKCAKAWLEPFELSLQRPLKIKGHTITVRQGVWLHIEDEAGNVGLGEIAPLPQVSCETLEQALDQLQVISDNLVRREFSDATDWIDTCFDGATEGQPAPSVQCGVDMALRTLAWSREGTLNTLPGRSVQLNGLAMGDDVEILDQVARLLDAGYSCIKVKVGRHPLAQDIRRIQSVKEIIAGRATLRLDANRAWFLDEALRFAHEVGNDRVEYIEEPVVGRDEQIEFHRRTGMPLALDESLGPTLAPSRLELTGVAALILKPTALGGLRRVEAFMNLAATRGIRAILSSAFESAAALRFYASLAALKGTPGEAHGLDTWRWLPEKHATAWLTMEGPSIQL